MFSKKIQFCYNWFFRPHFIAGERAEYQFRKDAQKDGWIVEKIDQSKESIQQYKNRFGSSVKRGDFICRNCNSIEIEVKCLQKYDYDGEACYYLSYSDWKRHESMIQQLKVADLVFAFYGRNGRFPEENSLKMVSMTSLKNTQDYREGKLYEPISK